MSRNQTALLKEALACRERAGTLIATRASCSLKQPRIILLDFEQAPIESYALLKEAHTKEQNLALEAIQEWVPQTVIQGLKAGLNARVSNPEFEESLTAIVSDWQDTSKIWNDSNLSAEALPVKGSADSIAKKNRFLISNPLYRIGNYDGISLPFSNTLPIKRTPVFNIEKTLEHEIAHLSQHRRYPLLSQTDYLFANFYLLNQEFKELRKSEQPTISEEQLLNETPRERFSRATNDAYVLFSQTIKDVLTEFKCNSTRRTFSLWKEMYAETLSYSLGDGRMGSLFSYNEYLDRGKKIVAQFEAIAPIPELLINESDQYQPINQKPSSEIVALNLFFSAVEQAQSREIANFLSDPVQMWQNTPSKFADNIKLFRHAFPKNTGIIWEWKTKTIAGLENPFFLPIMLPVYIAHAIYQGIKSRYTTKTPNI
ncbi:MAG: hypothetical protein Q7K43_02680 [Candidatus Woesearchaeota archaeon]|nr:hypothetical protein [Candidatus Woesearchaeota archaeon]